MHHPLRILLAEYTLMSFIMTIIMPVSLYATEDINTGSWVDITITEIEPLTKSGESDQISQIITIPDEVIGSGTSEESELIDNSWSVIPSIDTGTGEAISTENTGNITPSIEINSGTIVSEETETSTIIVSHEMGANTGTVEVPEIVTESISEKNVSLEKKWNNTHENEILIQFKWSIDSTTWKYQIDQMESLHDLKTIETLEENNIVIMESNMPNIITSITDNDVLTNIAYQKEENVKHIIQELKNDPRIAHVQKNFVYTMESTNDPDYSKLWGLHNAGQLINWVSGEIDADIDHPEAIQYASGKLWTGVIVAVLDTGIAYNHPDLIWHMWNGTQCLSDTGATLGGCIHGFDFAYEDSDPSDIYGHGTHIAGTIGAMSNNATGIIGIAPNIQLMAVKIFDDNGQGTTASVIRGINFAKYNWARIINASIGTENTVNSKSDFDFFMYETIKQFPGLFITAAGNDGTDYSNMPNTKNYPSGFGSATIVSGEIIVNNQIVVSGEESIPGLPNIISVAASDQDDHLAYFSNYGTGTVDIAAPGTNIYSTAVINTMVSGEIDLISYQNAWNKQSGAPSSSWETRSGLTTHVQWINFSGALWGNNNTPYISGEDHYIEKTFNNLSGAIDSIGLNIWCDTPSSNYYTDYLEVLVNTGWVYNPIRKIDEDIITFNLWSNSLTVDGHTGSYVHYVIDNWIIWIPQNGVLGLRLRWHSDAIDDLEGGIPHYGCSVQNTTINTLISWHGYKYKNGTSMAAPHVAGAAALAWSYKWDATIQDIRSAIIWGWDYKNTLNNIMSSRRLNVNNMLKWLEKPTIISQKVTLSGESGANFVIESNLSDHYPTILVSNNLNFYSSSVFKPYAEILADYGVISNQSNEAGYHLGDNMTRAELAKIAANIGWYVVSNCSGTVFTDVNSTLGDLCGAIETLAEAGVISSANASFHPYASVTRGETIKTLLVALGETGSSTDAGYLDTTNLGDITLYINRANEIGCIADATYFHPLATISRGEVYKMTVCTAGYDNWNIWTISNDTSTYANQVSASGAQYKFGINSLTADTLYYYKIQDCTIVYCNTDINTIYTFRTPKSVASNNNNQIVVSGEIYAQWSTGTGIIFSWWTNSGHIILINTGSAITVDLPTHNLHIISSGLWNGILEAPEVVNTGTTITISGNSPRTVQQIWSVWNTDTSLSLSGQVATITLIITAQSGSTADVFRTPNINTPYTQIATCTITNNRCTFTTNHFSLFALGNIQQPNSVNNANPNNNGSIVSVMRGGGGAVSSPSEPTNMTNIVWNTPNTILYQNKKVSRSEKNSKWDQLEKLQKQLENKKLSKSTRKSIKRSIQRIYKNQINLMKTWSRK